MGVNLFRIIPLDFAPDLGRTIVRFCEDQLYTAFQRCLEFALALFLPLSLAVLALLALIFFVIKGEDIAVHKEGVMAPLGTGFRNVGGGRIGSGRIGSGRVGGSRVGGGRVSFCDVGGSRVGGRGRGGLGFRCLRFASAKRDENENTKEDGSA